MGAFLHMVATGCYTGYLPGAPGTWGTLLVGLPLCLLVKQAGEGPFLLVTACVVLLSVWASGFVERSLGEKDPSFVVIDEVAGMMVSMALLPASFASVVLACALFRLFDIVKPYPIRLIDRRLSGGWGITLDDVMAGLYANLSSHALLLLL